MRKRAVNQISLSGDYIARFESQSEAAKEMGVPRGGIYNCCTGIAKTCRGYQWEYADEDEE